MTLKPTLTPTKADITEMMSLPPDQQYEWTIENKNLEIQRLKEKMGEIQVLVKQYIDGEDLDNEIRESLLWDIEELSETMSMYKQGGKTMKDDKTYHLDSYYVEVFEDSYEDGEGNEVHSWNSRDMQDGNTEFPNKDALFNYIKDIIERDVAGNYELKDDYFNVDEDINPPQTTITTSVIAKYNDIGRGYDHYEYPTEDELDKWKKGEQKLFSVRFAFFCEVYNKKRLSFGKGGKITTAQEYHKARNKEYEKRIKTGIIKKDTDENFMNFDEEYWNELVNKGKIDPDNYFAKGGEITSDLVMKMTPNSEFRYKGKVYLKSDYGNWRNDKDRNDILVNRDILKLAKGMTAYKYGNHHIIVDAKSFAKGGSLEFDEGDVFIDNSEFKDLKFYRDGEEIEIVSDYDSGYGKIRYDEEQNDREYLVINDTIYYLDDLEVYAKGGLIKVREAIEYDNNNFGKRKKLDLEKGSREWRGLYLEIQPLVWARNFQDGYNVDVYEGSRYNKEHLGTLNIDYSGGSMEINEESFAKGGKIEVGDKVIAIRDGVGVFSMGKGQRGIVEEITSGGKGAMVELSNGMRRETLIKDIEKFRFFAKGGVIDGKKIVALNSIGTALDVKKGYMFPMYADGKTYDDYAMFHIYQSDRNDEILEKISEKDKVVYLKSLKNWK